MAASCESSLPVSCFSNASSFFASSRVPSNVSRIFTKARMTNTLIWTARVLRRTFAACRAPCSVKAEGRYVAPRCLPELLEGELKHKVRRETMAVTFDGFIEAKRGDTIDFCEVAIQHHSNTANAPNH